MLGHQGNRCGKLFITPLGTTYHSGFAVGVFVKELELQNNARTQANVIKMHENACNHGTFPLLRPSPSRTSITAERIDLPIKESSSRDLPAVRSHQQSPECKQPIADNKRNNQHEDDDYDEEEDADDGEKDDPADDDYYDDEPLAKKMRL